MVLSQVKGEEREGQTWLEPGDLGHGVPLVKGEPQERERLMDVSFRQAEFEVKVLYRQKCPQGSRRKTFSVTEKIWGAVHRKEVVEAVKLDKS